MFGWLLQNPNSLLAVQASANRASNIKSFVSNTNLSLLVNFSNCTDHPRVTAVFHVLHIMLHHFVSNAPQHNPQHWLASNATLLARSLPRVHHESSRSEPLCPKTTSLPFPVSFTLPIASSLGSSARRICVPFPHFLRPQSPTKKHPIE